MKKRVGICLLCASLILSAAGCAHRTPAERIPNRVEREPSVTQGDTIITNSIEGSNTSQSQSGGWTSAVQPGEGAILKNDFSAETHSLLESQVGYSRYGYKAVYIRSAVDPGEAETYAPFSLISAENGRTVYEGKAVYWGEKWNSYWWVADFSACEEDGKYFVRIPGENGDLESQVFAIGRQILTDSSIQMVLFDQLDARRSPGKLGWRDSSTDELREIHANIIAIQTLCDVYDTIYDSLSAENQAKLLDNIRFGCEYLLALQERTDDPLTNGRFKHDLYDTQYSAPKIRNFYDIVNAMAALARSYRVMKDHDPAVAQTYKEAFELSYELCVLRPYYLESEFTLEVPDGRKGVTAAAKIRYGINSMLWEFPTELRTRDRLMFMKACTEMFKATGDTSYMDKARELAAQIADRQYTDYDSAPDGCYGMFREFDNNETAFMVDWLQSFGQNLGCIQPTDLEPFIDLIAYDPDSPDAARWHNVIRTFADGYIKNSAGLTPLGIYPVAAYMDEENGGVKFFQSISHGANNLYGLMGRNMMILGNYLNDSSLQQLAQRNAQFVIGLNPGMPNAYEETQWTSYSFIYGLGNRSFSGFYGEGSRYIPPLGSGINGFTAAPQFTERRIGDDPDLPKGILNEDGSYQFNEDYLPHSMAFISAAVLSEAPYTLTLRTQSGGKAVASTVTATVDGRTVGTYEIPASGELTISDLPLGQAVTVEVSGSGKTARRTFGTVGAGSGEWTVDFESLLYLEVTAPTVVSGDAGQVEIRLKNEGTADMSVSLNLLADGVQTGQQTLQANLSPGDEQTLRVAIASTGVKKPYALLVQAAHGGQVTQVAVAGLAK